MFYLLTALVMLVATHLAVFYRGRLVEHSRAQSTIDASATRNRRIQQDRLRLIRRDIFNQFVLQARRERTEHALDLVPAIVAQNANSRRQAKEDEGDLIAILLDDFNDDDKVSPQIVHPELPQGSIGGSMEYPHNPNDYPESDLFGGLDKPADSPFYPGTPSKASEPVLLPTLEPTVAPVDDEYGFAAYKAQVDREVLVGLPKTDGPTPGSKVAVKCGCTCSPYDNQNGLGYLGGIIDDKTGRTVFVYTTGCPVHWPAELMAKVAAE